MVAENESDGVFKDEDRVPVITDPFQGKIRLLDVGSCYNPFREFPEFEPIGIDLCPATDTVFQCDFLSLTISRPLTPPALTSHLSAMSSPVTQLPSGAFHVVVFSLLLEYMPSRLQRWRCCLKAHALLAVNGLLIVVTPDSHSLHRNAPMMKSWKQAIEAVGFRRWRYEKQSHIHCMAFRKITEKVAVEEKETDKYVEMMYIPQDFKEDADEKAPKKRKTKHKVAAKSDSAQQEK
ncbi:S-adenosylmethionine sensor upstream of mTORC1 [Aplysia californica]|uniref:S-adenosylmethionine sensor upstream of mTORC1 n=1 Tax=Aplysia californica TaxID=6500 RepID=A0ABM0K6D8_APLCA|nr:S-adenosylmethionine sensor upstream of mTORC1 [Aplysia californica]